MQQERKKMLLRVGDLAAILLVLLLVGALLGAFFAKEQGTAVRISVEGETVAVLPLFKDAVYPITSRGHSLTVCIENGEVLVRDTDCPDKVCQNTGRISAKGASIVCAPAGVSVHITGGGDGDADFVAG